MADEIVLQDMKTLLIFFGCLSNCISYSQNNIDYRVDSLFKSYLDSGLAGSVIVVKDNRVILEKAYGYSNNEKKTLNTPATLFNVASIGKQFTMYAIMQLERKGLISTDDLLSKYIGPFHDQRDSITIFHMLSHTSGIVKEGTGLDEATRSKFIQSIKSAQSESKPGTKFRYTNAGYSMLAAVVEIASGLTFEKYIREKIFKPLKMKHTSFPWEEHTEKKLLATGYNSNHEAQPVQENIWATRGPGNLVTTMRDLYKWLQAYENEKFMPVDIKNKILYDYNPGNESYSLHKDLTKRKTRFYNKGGGRQDFETRLMWFPDDKVIIIFSLNNDYNLARKLFISIRGFMN